jgi:PAS domain-containing protein
MRDRSAKKKGADPENGGNRSPQPKKRVTAVKKAVSRQKTGGPQEALAVSHAAEDARQRTEELEKVMDLVPAAVWVALDPQCYVIFGNREANRFFEASEQENVSAGPAPGTQDCTRRFFCGGRELTPEELPMQQAATKGVDVRDAEVEVLLPSGTSITLLGSASPLWDAQGQIRGSVAAFVDITERKRAEQELARLNETLEQRVSERTARLRKTIRQLRQEIEERTKTRQALAESEEEFRTLAEQSPNMIFINFQGRCVYANPKCEELMGYTREEFYAPDFDFRCLIAPDSKDLIEDWYGRLTRGEETGPVEYALVTKTLQIRSGQDGGTEVTCTVPANGPS